MVSNAPPAAVVTALELFFVRTVATSASRAKKTTLLANAMTVEVSASRSKRRRTGGGPPGPGARLDRPAPQTSVTTR